MDGEYLKGSPNFQSDFQPDSNQILHSETFVSSTDFSSAINQEQWDALVDRGTGTKSIESKWERESLYQNFDPLVTAHEKRQAISTNMEPPRLREHTQSNESRRIIQQELSQLIPMGTPILNKNQNQGRMNIQEEPSCPETDHSANDNEEFVSVMNNNDWDLLVERGSRSHRENKWERESLYQKFDPLVSAKDRNQAFLNHMERLATTREQSPLDESAEFPRHDISKLIPIETPPPNKHPVRLTARAKVAITETQPSCDDDNFLESIERPHNLDVPVDESEEIEITKLKDALEKQAKSFHDQLHLRALQLKEIEATIVAAAKKLESQQQSSRVKKEYKKSIATLENEIDRVKRQINRASQDRSKILEERDLAADDLRRAELAFSDLHGKYEKAKQLVSNFKKNEEILNNRYDVMKLKLEHRDVKLKYLQDSVEDVFQRMKLDYETRIKSEDVEGNRIRAQLRKLELRMSTIEKDLQQKEKENSQLSVLCDDLIKGRRN